MDKQENIFMSTGTVLGIAIAFIISLYIYFLNKEYTLYIPFIFIIPTLLLRSIGKLMDMIHNKKQ